MQLCHLYVSLSCHSLSTLYNGKAHFTKFILCCFGCLINMDLFHICFHSSPPLKRQRKSKNSSQVEWSLQLQEPWDRVSREFKSMQGGFRLFRRTIILHNLCRNCHIETDKRFELVWPCHDHWGLLLVRVCLNFSLFDNFRACLV